MEVPLRTVSRSSTFWIPTTVRMAWFPWWNCRSWWQLVTAGGAWEFDRLWWGLHMCNRTFYQTWMQQCNTGMRYTFRIFVENHQASLLNQWPFFFILFPWSSYNFVGNLTQVGRLDVPLNRFQRTGPAVATVFTAGGVGGPAETRGIHRGKAAGSLPRWGYTMIIHYTWLCMAPYHVWLKNMFI